MFTDYRDKNTEICSGQYFLIQRCIPNPLKHLSWSFCKHSQEVQNTSLLGTH